MAKRSLALEFPHDSEIASIVQDRLSGVPSGRPMGDILNLPVREQQALLVRIITHNWRPEHMSPKPTRSFTNQAIGHQDEHGPTSLEVLGALYAAHLARKVDAAGRGEHLCAEHDDGEGQTTRMTPRGVAVRPSETPRQFAYDPRKKAPQVS